MKMLIKNKKAIAPIFIFVIIILALIGIYLLLFIPVPAFAKMRTIINYFLIIILWFIVQGLIIFGYYKLGTLVIKGLKLYQVKIVDWSLRVKDIIVARR